MSRRKIADIPTQSLIESYESYHEAISVIGCYGTKDLIRKDEIETELNRRGFRLRMIPKWELLVVDNDNL